MRRKNFKTPTKDILYQKYIIENKSMNNIAAELNIAVGSVFNYIKKYEIKSRPQNQGFLGKTHTKETREKISKANKGKVITLEQRKKIAEARKLKKVMGRKKKRSDGYIAVFYPRHPFSNKDGMVMEHRLIMEQHIGRYIRADEVVHHKNGIRDDNRLENLELMTIKEHAGFHMKERWNKKKGVDDLSIK